MPLGLPAREDIVIIAESLSQVSHRETGDDRAGWKSCVA